MLEPTVNKTANTRPIEISEHQGDSLTSLTNNEHSLSAYASAESSPNQHGGLVSTEDTFSMNELVFPKTESSCSINTYWGLPPASSLLIDENDKLDAIRASAEKNNSFKSNNFTSLPNQSKSDESQTNVEHNTTLKKEMSESDLFKMNVVDGDLVNVSLKDNVKPEQLLESNEALNPQPQRSSTLSLIEKIFSKTSPKPEHTSASTVVPTEVSSSNSKGLSTNPMLSHTGVLTSNATASSPNPECSPYKFLINEYSSKSSPTVETKPDDVKSTQQIKVDQNINQSIPATNKILENLASLNHKECEKHDPILSASGSTTASSSSSGSLQKSPQSSKPSVLANACAVRSPSKSVSSLPSCEQTNSMKVHHVPSSSREFCMNLNFNLASAAAATAGGPIAVLDNNNTQAVNKSPVNQEHNRFTSNASTSSIHNDLKMILEESKESKPKSTTPAAPTAVEKPAKQDKLNTSLKKESKPKPQRQHKHKNNNSSTSSGSNSSFNSSTVEPVETADTKSNDLIKIMMMLVKGNGKSIQQKQTAEEPSLIEWTKQNGHYRYEKDFLVQIKDQRAAFIDQIYPDIFKAYCYCMNGKYWDPEKYFDIVQFPGEFDRIPANRNNSNNNYNRNTSSANSYHNRNNMGINRKKQTPNSYNQYKSGQYDAAQTPTSASHLVDDSPQPLQVPANSPKVFNQEETHMSQKNKVGKENKAKKASNNSILASLGLAAPEHQENKLDADKLLLSLIKNEKTFEQKISEQLNSSETKKSINLMDILNKKPVKHAKKTNQSPSILDSLFKTAPVTKSESAETPRHYPLILTAQELEMSQLNQEKLSKCKLPNEITTKSDDKSELNDSYAYKQLVKNLSNHPLNSPANLSTKHEGEVKSKSKKTSSSKPSWQVSNNGTTILKQLLNLQPEQNTEKKHTKSSKKHHHKSHKSSQLSTSQASSCSSTTSPSPSDTNQFPLVNPHEKPFESFMAEENRKQIEQVVAVALNQVLNKSPTQCSPASNQTSPRNPIEDLMDKINSQHQRSPIDKLRMEQHVQHEHFASLINKMSAKSIEASSVQANSSDILKWFTDAKHTMPVRSNQFSAATLSEIEFMEMHRTKNALNKLF